MWLSSVAFIPWVCRRRRALMTYVPTAPSPRAPAATPSRAASWPRTRWLISSTRIPALTRPTIRSPSRIGVTARTDGPRVPV
ncbi:hypothetical protein SGRIM128S_00837 [Streptomyces griseomycini]